MNRNIVRRLFIVVLLGVASFLVLLPLFRPGFPVTDDGNWMIVRLSAFYQSFRDGQFPVRFLGRLNFSYGYPVANFLYPGFLYLGSFVHIFGLNFQNVIKVIMASSIVIGAVALYFWLRYFFDEISSALGSLSFLFMPYVFYDLYKRGSVGELLAMGVCMVALWAIEGGYRWILPPVVAMLAISHNTLALFFIGVLFFYIILKQFKKLIIPFFLGLVMSAFFWLPAIFDQSIVIFNTVSISDPTQYFKDSQQLLLLGLTYLIACLLAFFWGNRTYSKERNYFSVILIGSTLFATSITSFVWHISLFARLIQFPFRFFSLWIFAAPWFIADIANSRKRLRFWILGLFVLANLYFVVLPYQKTQNVINPEGYFTTNEATTTVANEYMPKWINVYPTQRSPNRFEIYQGNATVEERKVTTNLISLIVHAKDSSILQVNTIYYPGWGVMIDNKPAEILYDNPFGLMQIVIPSGNHIVYMTFRETAGRFVADSISVVAIILYIIFFIILEIVYSFNVVKKQKNVKK